MRDAKRKEREVKAALKKERDAKKNKNKNNRTRRWVQTHRGIRPSAGDCNQNNARHSYRRQADQSVRHYGSLNRMQRDARREAGDDTPRAARQNALRVAHYNSRPRISNVHIPQYRPSFDNYDGRIGYNRLGRNPGNNGLPVAARITDSRGDEVHRSMGDYAWNTNVNSAPATAGAYVPSGRSEVSTTEAESSEVTLEETTGTEGI